MTSYQDPLAAPVDITAGHLGERHLSGAATGLNWLRAGHASGASALSFLVWGGSADHRRPGAAGWRPGAGDLRRRSPVPRPLRVASLCNWPHLQGAAPLGVPDSSTWP